MRQLIFAILASGETAYCFNAPLDFDVAAWAASHVASCHLLNIVRYHVEIITLNSEATQ
jgi:hypothetical protein